MDERRIKDGTKERGIGQRNGATVARREREREREIRVGGCRIIINWSSELSRALRSSLSPSTFIFSNFFADAEFEIVLSTLAPNSGLFGNSDR